MLVSFLHNIEADRRTENVDRSCDGGRRFISRPLQLIADRISWPISSLFIGRLHLPQQRQQHTTNNPTRLRITEFKNLTWNINRQQICSYSFSYKAPSRVTAEPHTNYTSIFPGYLTPFRHFALPSCLSPPASAIFRTPTTTFGPFCSRDQRYDPTKAKAAAAASAACFLESRSSIRLRVRRAEL